MVGQTVSGLLLANPIRQALGLRGLFRFERTLSLPLRFQLGIKSEHVVPGEALVIGSSIPQGGPIHVFDP
jgi:hypothetical protein